MLKLSLYVWHRYGFNSVSGGKAESCACSRKKLVLLTYSDKRTVRGGPKKLNGWLTARTELVFIARWWSCGYTDGVWDGETRARQDVSECAQCSTPSELKFVILTAMQSHTVTRVKECFILLVYTRFCRWSHTVYHRHVKCLCITNMFGCIRWDIN